MRQEILNIPIKKLHLWTENPRDPIGESIGDLEIIKRAIKDDDKKWNIPKLIKNMGNYYHYNKLPIIVLESERYVVYDGNCRIAILKYLQNPQWSHEIENSLFPSKEPADLKKLVKIPCAVCDRKTALDIIYKDNISNNTWDTLTQHYFEHYYLEKQKSTFLMFEEITGLVSKNKKLNQRFVADEIITEKGLNDIGFRIKNDKLESVYPEDKSRDVLRELIVLIETGQIKTRTDKERGTIRVTDKNIGGLSGAMERLSPEIGKEIRKFDTKNKEEVQNSPVNIPDTLVVSENINRHSVKRKPALGRKKIPLALKKLIDECYKLDKNSFANAKTALTRITLERTLKFVVENTKFNSKNNLSEALYFKEVYYYYDKKNKKWGGKRPFANFEIMTKRFIELIKVTKTKEAFKNFDNHTAHQVIHNYLVISEPASAETKCINLLPLLEFLLQEENELLKLIDLTKL